MKNYNNRLDKLEVVIIEEHAPSSVNIARYSGEEGRGKEKEYLLQQAKARLGLCEESSVIFISNRVKLIKEEYPRFPWGIPEEMAKDLIKECENEAIEK